MSPEFSILGAVGWFAACAALIVVGAYRRKWTNVMIGVMLLTVAVWNTLAYFE